MRKWKRRLFIKLIKIIIFCVIIGILGIAGIFAYFTKDLPDPTQIGQRRIIESTKIFDRTGQILLYDIHGEEKRTVIAFDQIPQYVKDATIVIEDDNFYHHFGLDVPGIIRAAIANLRGKKIAQGGSTITQQYIKNAYLGGPMAQRTFARKIKEAILSLLLERKYTKDEILGFYLNQVPYGSNAYGIESASQTFFNKSAEELTLSQASLLGALTQAPSYYSPYGSHPDDLVERQHYLLDRMVKFGYISQEEAEGAKNEELVFASQEGLKAHHFVAMIREYLEDKYSHLYADINSAGLKVQTTIDWDLQQLAEEVIAKGAENNEKNYRATNSALVAINPKNGQLLALVGSKDYSENQFNVATSPHRQPGSSFKPFAYAAAFQKGYTPDTILFDLETSFGEFGPPGQEKEYIPQNYDLKFRGPVTMRQGLAQSLNLPSVKTLYLAGIDETIKLAQDMGITTLKDRKSYGLSLVLGGGEVKLLDETAAYGVFATNGIKHPLAIIIKVEDAQGNVLEEYEDKPVRVLEVETARQINNILSDEEARAPMMGSHSKLYLPGRPAAAKTGTTQDYSDGWTIGYTPSLVTGVWSGNNDFTKKMRAKAAGLYVAAPIWNDFMVQAYQKKIKDEDNSEIEIKDNEFFLSDEVEEFTPPEPTPTNIKSVLRGEIGSTRKVKIDIRTGQPATGSTPIGYIEEKIYHGAHCILYYLNKDNPLADFPAGSSQDPQFSNWETPVLAWAGNRSCQQYPCSSYNQNPSSQTDSNSANNNLLVKITSPQEEDLITQEQDNLTINVYAEADNQIKQIDFFLDDQLIASDNTAPYSTTFNPYSYIKSSAAILTQHVIKAHIYDQSNNKKEDKITIYIKE